MRVNTIVVGFDGSANARRALEAAIDLVAANGVVHVVTAFHMPSSSETSQILKALPAEFKDTYDPLASLRTHLHDAEAFLEAAGVGTKGHFVEDHPAAAILEVANEIGADLIIVGSRGLGRATRFLRGSVSTRVADHAETSFMVIQDDDHTDG